MLRDLVHAVEKLHEDGAAILIRAVSFTVVAPMCKPMAKGKPVFLDEHFEPANCSKIGVQKHLRQSTHLRSPVPKHMEIFLEGIFQSHPKGLYKRPNDRMNHRE